MTLTELAKKIVEQRAAVQEAWARRRADYLDQAAEDVYWREADNLWRLAYVLFLRCMSNYGTRDALIRDAWASANSGQVPPEDISEWLWTLDQEWADVKEAA